MDVSISHNGTTIAAHVIVADRHPSGTIVTLVSGDFPTTREMRVDVSRTIITNLPSSTCTRAPIPPT